MLVFVFGVVIVIVIVVPFNFPPADFEEGEVMDLVVDVELLLEEDVEMEEESRMGSGGWEVVWEMDWARRIPEERR